MKKYLIHFNTQSNKTNQGQAVRQGMGKCKTESWLLYQSEYIEKIFCGAHLLYVKLFFFTL